MMGLTCGRRYVLLLACGFFLAAGACGCGSKTGTVKGKVTVDGKPVPGANLMFTAGDKGWSMANVEADGSYEATEVPIGPVKVAIWPPGAGPGPRRQTRPMSPGMENTPDQLPAGSIPPRYTKPDTSDLTLTVHSSSNDFDIEITSKK